jgi:hypothetical protein
LPTEKEGGTASKGTTASTHSYLKKAEGRPRTGTATPKDIFSYLKIARMNRHGRKQRGKT